MVPAPAGGTHERLLALTGALAAPDPPRLVGPVDAAGGGGRAARVPAPPRVRAGGSGA